MVVRRGALMMLLAVVACWVTLSVLNQLVPGGSVLATMAIAALVGGCLVGGVFGPPVRTVLVVSLGSAILLVGIGALARLERGGPAAAAAALQTLVAICVVQALAMVAASRLRATLG